MCVAYKGTDLVSAYRVLPQIFFFHRNINYFTKRDEAQILNVTKLFQPFSFTSNLDFVNFVIV